MALIQCHECSARVSDDERTCPKCGAPVIATIKRRKKADLVSVGIQLVSICVVFIVAWFLAHHLGNLAVSHLKVSEQNHQSPQ
jgi:predicted nucleic acid-binding Zn ribbon protein